MDFTYYPIENATFYKNDNVNVIKSDINCLNTNEYNVTPNENVIYGYHKPLNEICKPINTNHFNTGPDNSNTSSIWNNMTKRKSLVKDY